jgi:predicted transcriptional regulator
VAQDDDRRTVLMSIHPRHAEKLLAGTKLVELRKAAFASEVVAVVVYATAPTKAVVGVLEVEAVEQQSPSKIWAMYGDATGITRREFRHYYRGRRRAVAIRVRKASRLETPMPLRALGSDLVPPQSYRYLPDAAAARVRDAV